MEKTKTQILNNIDKKYIFINVYSATILFPPPAHPVINPSLFSLCFFFSHFLSDRYVDNNDIAGFFMK